MTPKLDVNGVSFSYHTLEGETLALSDISFSLSPGEFAAVVGPSGCGKSTLLSLLCGLSKPDTGQILLDGHPLRQSPSDTGYMLQKDHLFPWRDILSNVSLGLEIQNRLTPKTTARLKEMLSAYGLEGFEHARPSELSGGMRQRAALIRTLALEPDLLVTHDLSEAISIADRIIILTPRPGRIKKILPIHFPADCATPLKRRNCPEFSGYFNAVWKELKTDE